MANEFKIKKGLIVTGASGGTVVDIQGSQGQLFSVTDDLSGSIFAVSDISGVPILDVNSSGLVTVDGPFTQTGGGATILSGTLNVDGVSTLANVGYLGDGLGSVQYTLQSANNGFATIDFGDVADSNIGRLSYNHNDNSFLIRTNNATALILNSSQNAIFAGDVTVSGGDLTINSTGNAILNVNGTADSFIEKDTGTDLYIANNVGDKDIKFRVKDNTTNVIALTIDGSEGGDSTFAAQAFSAATSSGDGSSTLTTKGYVDGLITGATIYRGAWDPSGGGYGSPDLSGVTQTSGYYYICSAAGTAEPNGTGTEPDTWETGDWVIYNDVSGTGQWQKIDNSSVLSGVGTGQTVALWEGAGSVTDSETLGNAPITVSGNNTTFAGDLNISAGKKLQYSANSFMTPENNVSGAEISTAGTFIVKTGTTPTLGLTLDASQNATFAGDVEIRTGNKLILQRPNNGVATEIYTDATGAMVLNSINVEGFDFQNAGVNALGIDGSSNATFAGNITAGGAVYPATNAGASLGLSDKQWAGLDLSSSSAITWGNGDAEIVEGEVSNYSLSFKTYDGTNNSRALLLEGDNNATFTGDVTATTFLGNSTTQTAGDNSTLIATTAYADAAAAAVPIGDYLPLAGGTLTGNLEISGADLLFAADSSGDGFQMDYFDTKMYLGKKDGSSWHMVIQDDGNVGIGTTSPVSLLHIKGADPVFTIQDTSTGTAQASSTLRLGESGSGGVLDVYWDIKQASDILNTHLEINHSANGNALTILDNKNVGIGTTSPNSSLQVGLGTTNQQSSVASIGTSVDGLTSVLSLVNQAGNNTDGNGVSLDFHNASNWSATGRISVIHPTATTGTATNSSMQFSTYGTVGSTTTFEPRMTIDYRGNVGIGTTSPVDLLAIHNSTAGAVDAQMNFTTSATGQGVSDGFRVGWNGAVAQMYLFEDADMRFATNNAERMRITSAGNVGIGTTSPDTGIKLDVRGVVQAKDSYFNAGLGNTKGYNFHDFGTGWGLKGPQNPSRIALFTDTAERLTVSSGGNVGIGTTTPLAKLDIQGTQGQLFSVTDDLSGDIFSVADISGVPIMNVNSDGTSYFDGNVGIGTISPSVPLAVEGVASMGSNSRLSMGILDINANGTPTQILIQTTIPFNSGSADFTVNIKGFVYGTDESCNLSIHWHYYNSVPYNANITSSGSWAPIAKLHQSSTGFVQIHLLSPGYWPKLYVESMYSSAYNDAYASGWSWSDAAGTGTAYALDYNKDFGNNFVMTDPGNVGIGTNSPGAKLEVSNGSSGYSGSYNGRTSAVFEGNNSGGNTISIMSPSTGYSGLFFGNETTETLGQIHFKHSENAFTFVNGGGNERMRINSAGKVGIGITNPTGKLTVVSDNEYNSGGGLRLQSSSSADRTLLYFSTSQSNEVSTIQCYRDGTGNGVRPLLLNPQGGNVGIGTTSPTNKLHVDGSIKWEGVGTAGILSGSEIDVSIAAQGSVPLILSANNSESLLLDPNEYVYKLGDYTDDNNGAYLEIDDDGALATFYNSDLDIRGGIEAEDNISAGQDVQAGSRMQIDNVKEYRESFTANGNSTLSFDVDIKNVGASGQPFEVFAGWTHYSTSFGCMFKAAYFQRSTIQSDITLVQTLINQSSLNGGFWSVSYLDANTIRITKNAGSHTSSGHGYIRVTHL